MKILFFAAFALYGVSVILEFTGTAFKKDGLLKAAWYVFLVAFAVHLAFIITRGIAAKRLPLSNQFEFANAFAWGVALVLVVMRPRLKTDWLSVVAMPAALLVMTYASLQPMEIRDLMPALRSAWFGVHIGSAVVSYAAFVIAGCIGLRYLLAARKENADERALAQMDYISYRLVAFGFLDLGSQRSLGAHYLDHLCGVPASAHTYEAPGDCYGLVPGDCGSDRILYLCRG